MTRYGISIDLHRCVGCQTCVLACKMQNNVPDGMLWNRVVTEGSDVLDGSVGTYPQLTRTYVPIACQHCENAACQRVCPTGATYKDELGRVQIDYDKCIGCRMCMAACPYNARSFNWEEPKRNPDINYGGKDVPVRPKGVAEKCTMCKQLTDNGEEPMCVQCCPGMARTFGDLDDPGSAVSRKIRERKRPHAFAGAGYQAANPLLQLIVPAALPGRPEWLALRIASAPNLGAFGLSSCAVRHAWPSNTPTLGAETLLAGVCSKRRDQSCRICSRGRLSYRLPCWR